MTAQFKMATSGGRGCRLGETTEWLAEIRSDADEAKTYVSIRYETNTQQRNNMFICGLCFSAMPCLWQEILKTIPFGAARGFATHGKVNIGTPFVHSLSEIFPRYER
jgi:hypothetical protein